MTGRPEASHWYDGRVYAAVIDRMLAGVDLSPRHIEYARGHTGSSSAEFRVGDVAELSVPPEGRYDVAVIVLALHEMPRHVQPAR